MSLIFEWDPIKARRNARKHRISFEEASTAFGDPFSITVADARSPAPEERLVLLGSTNRGRLVVVVHVERGENVRILSARRATRREQHMYEEA
jgi:uncharacterized protein